jgi:hypothetical protein
VIVIAKKVGRLANRILLFAHFIGIAVEYGFTIVNPTFGNYAGYFPSTARDLLCRFPPALPVPPMPGCRELLYRAGLLVADVLHFLQSKGVDVGLIRLRRDQYLELDSPAFLTVARRHRILLVQDWFFRSPSNCEKHREVIRSHFTPWQHHLDHVRALVEPARTRGRFVVGVHVRQTDYRRYKEGRFFYSHEQYRGVMEKVQAVFSGTEVSFLVCSDAAVPPHAFAGFDVLYGNGHELEDLYALAACDRLIGPPSTYSKWASFYGAVPRYEIIDPAQELNVRSFRIESGLAHTPLPDTPVP